MSHALRIEVQPRPFERVDADVVVAGVHSDDRPLRGGAARVDWRLCGLVSQLLVHGTLDGEPGDAVLMPSLGRMRAPRILLLGLGARGSRSSVEVCDLVRDAVGRVVGLGMSRMAMAPLGFAGDEWARHAQAIVEGGVEAVSAADAELDLVLAVSSAAEARARASIGAVIDALGRPAVQLIRRENRAAANAPSRRRTPPQGQPGLHRAP